MYLDLTANASSSGFVMPACCLVVSDISEGL